MFVSNCTYSLFQLASECLDLDGKYGDLFVEFNGHSMVIVSRDTQLIELAFQFPVSCGELTTTALLSLQLSL